MGNIILQVAERIYSRSDGPCEVDFSRVYRDASFREYINRKELVVFTSQSVAIQLFNTLILYLIHTAQNSYSSVYVASAY